MNQLVSFIQEPLWRVSPALAPLSRNQGQVYLLQTFTLSALGTWKGSWQIQQRGFPLWVKKTLCLCSPTPSWHWAWCCRVVHFTASSWGPVSESGEKNLKWEPNWWGGAGKRSREDAALSWRTKRSRFLFCFHIYYTQKHRCPVNVLKSSFS